MEGNPKQLIVERIKNVTNILVTVSRDPSVDELAAALGFTLMLNKMDKHATAVFSGAIPEAITFLEPNKTFENTVDSLRDFIIALDKEKADRLRYKVEDDVVRIFITPYRTNITEADLNFSQGDFNVELIIALGVDKKEDLDAAITAHGRILHDATVVTINANNDENSLGSIDWSDASASSLCEMLMSLSEALQSGLLDQQIATSLLTGIVAATERFSNPRTSPKVMTMAAQLMAAGANQQLIASKLEEGHEIAPNTPVESDSSKKLEEVSSEKIATVGAKDQPPLAKATGEMRVEHDLPEQPIDTSKTAVEAATELATEAEEDRANELSQDKLLSRAAPLAPTLSVSDLQKDLEAATAEVESAAGRSDTSVPSVSTEEPTIGKAKSSDWRGKVIEPPSLGGTLNATSNEAEEDKMEEERSDRNHTILSHDGAGAGVQSINAVKDDQNEAPVVDIFAEPLSYESTISASKPLVITPIASSDNIAPDEKVVPHELTIAELEAQAHNVAKPATSPEFSSVNEARAAVDSAFGPTSVSTPQVPSFEIPPPPSSPQSFNAPLPPPPPPMPDFSSLPPLPPLPGESQIQTPPSTPQQFPQAPINPASPSDPGQFKIPGQ